MLKLDEWQGKYSIVSGYVSKKDNRFMPNWIARQEWDEKTRRRDWAKKDDGTLKSFPHAVYLGDRAQAIAQLTGMLAQLKK